MVTLWFPPSNQNDCAYSLCSASTAVVISHLSLTGKHYCMPSLFHHDKLPR